MSSFFANLSSYIPPLPSLSVPVSFVPQSIQRKLIGFLLRKSFGKYVQPGTLDEAKLEELLVVGQGELEIGGLELDAHAVSAFIPSKVPLHLTRVYLDQIQIQIPWGSSLFTSPLSLSVAAVRVEASFTPSSSPSPSDSPQQDVASSVDLSASVASVADEFVRSQLGDREEKELEKSMMSSAGSPEALDPFTEAEEEEWYPPGSLHPFTSAQSSSSSSDTTPPPLATTSLLTSLIEGILARLKIEVGGVSVNVRCAGLFEDVLEDELEVRVGKIVYRDEANTAASGDGIIPSYIRTLRVSSLDVLTRSYPTSPSTPMAASYTSSSSSEDDAFDPNSDLIMSLGVADLRESVLISQSVVGESVYASATGASFFSAKEGSDEEEDQRNERSVKMEKPELNVSPEWSTLVSFGADELVLKIIASMQPSKSTATSVSNSSSTSTPPSMPLITISLSLGTITTLILPNQARSISRMLALFTPPASSTPPPKNPPASLSPPRTENFQLEFSLKQILVLVVYEDLGNGADGGISEFWSTGRSDTITLGHLRLQIDNISGAYVDLTYSSSQVKSKVKQPPASPRMTVEIKEMLLFEALPSSSSGYGAQVPVFIFDPNLTQQYADTDTGGYGFPEFDVVDWRAATGPHGGGRKGDKAWRVKVKKKVMVQKSRGGIDAAQKVSEEPVIRIEKMFDANQVLNITTAPVHVYLDLSLVERLLPFLRSLAPLELRRVGDEDESDVTPPATPKSSYANPPPLERIASLVIDDLESDDRRTPASSSHSSAMAVALSCPLIRVSIRCPAPLKSGGIGEGSLIRSGITIIDVHQVLVRTGPSPLPIVTQQHRVSFGSSLGQFASQKQEPAISCQCTKSSLLFSRYPETKARAFLVLSPLPKDIEMPEEEALPLTFKFFPVGDETTLPSGGAHSVKKVEVHIPLVRAFIHKTTVEGLLFFADDVTQWLDGAFGDGSNPRPRDDIKLIGSRFFPPKPSITSSSGSSDGFERLTFDEPGLVVDLSINEADIQLLAPRVETSLINNSLRVIHLTLSDTDISLSVKPNAGNQNIIQVKITGVVLEDLSAPTKPQKIFALTTPHHLTSSPRPMIAFQMISLTDAYTGSKESSFSVDLAGFTFWATNDFSWIADLASFAKTPEGAFEDVVPNEVTRVTVKIWGGSVHVSAVGVEGALVLFFGNLDFSTALISDTTLKTLFLTGQSVTVLLIDDVNSPVPDRKFIQSPTGVDYWKSTAYASLLEVALFQGLIKLDPDATPTTEVQVTKSDISATLCADSLVKLGAFAGDLAKLAPRNEKPPVTPKVSSSYLPGRPGAIPIDILQSLDEDAFRQQPLMTTGPGIDFMTDDLPNNQDFLGSYAGPLPSKHVEETSVLESIETYENVTNDRNSRSNVISEVNGETVRLLHPDGIRIEENYLLTLESEEISYGAKLQNSALRVRLSSCNVSVQLFDGFDWHRTRKTIEDEIKAVRRRLEKIKQIFASGQQPDESAEELSSLVFNSVYIGPPANHGNMETSFLANLNDDDLLDLDGNDTASQASQSWQSFKGRSDSSSAPGISRHRSKKKKKLTRSKHCRIEINLSDIAVELDMMDPGLELGSRVHVAVKSLEILDHIKTSTWKKFLVEMRSDSRGNVRETDSAMVRIELLSVHPMLDNPDEEARLKVKVLPLRLHVDQDALDFLKRFFSFKDPKYANRAEATSKLASSETYIQHVEIFPIELKLDYKPKRVDYRGIREGRTIELMNFFHFDGAEMTLRHVTLSGINGWERMFNTLNDLWTPDVKANQLADVISGVAPIRSLVNVGSGVADLILLPIEQYKKDRRVVKGVQRGTTSFVKSTAMEAIKLGARLATGTQVILEHAESVLGGGKRFDKDLTIETMGEPLSYGESSDEEDEISKYANQPESVREGMSSAYKSLSKNLNSAAETILAVPMEVYERQGNNGPVRAVVRAIPIAVIRPMIGASEAVSKTLLGLRNTLDPEVAASEKDKYKRRNP